MVVPMDLGNLRYQVPEPYAFVPCLDDLDNQWMKQMVKPLTDCGDKVGFPFILFV